MSNEKETSMDLVPVTMSSISEDIQGGGNYFSGACETFEEKKRLVNAMSNPDFRTADFINKTINVVDVFMEMANVTDQNTGDLKPIPRVVLIDDKGKSYASLSFGIFNSLKKIISVFGFPTWDPAIPLEVSRVQKGDRQIYNLIVK